MAQNKGTSPWVYLGCGCAAFAGFCFMAVVGAGLFGAFKLKDYVDELKDPSARTERAREILGGGELPAGYHARVFFRIPWVLDVVILTDRESDEEELAELEEDLDDFEPLTEEHLGDHVFFYLALRGDKDVEDIFEGRSRSGEAQVDVGTTFEASEDLAEGSFELDSQRIGYSAHRGELLTEDHRRIPGVYSQMKITCPNDDGRVRVACWFERDPEDDSELRGTPADESALRDFMGHFNLCAGG